MTGTTSARATATCSRVSGNSRTSPPFPPTREPSPGQGRFTWRRDGGGDHGRKRQRERHHATRALGVQASAALRNRLARSDLRGLSCVRPLETGQAASASAGDETAGGVNDKAGPADAVLGPLLCSPLCVCASSFCLSYSP